MMRRKPTRSPLVTAREAGAPPRPLAPVGVRSRLPTAAALAVALAGLGCSSMIADPGSADPQISADPVKSLTTTTTSASAAPSASAPGAIDPEPHALPGEPAIVAPVASVKPVAIGDRAGSVMKPYAPGPKPASSHPKLPGKPALVHPASTIH